MDALPDRKTLNGKFSAYCKVCWGPYYSLWVDDEDHGGVCLFGHTKAHECPQAMGAAKFAADMQKLRDQGLIGSSAGAAERADTLAKPTTSQQLYPTKDPKHVRE